MRVTARLPSALQQAMRRLRAIGSFSPPGTRQGRVPPPPQPEPAAETLEAALASLAADLDRGGGALVTIRRDGIDMHITGTTTDDSTVPLLAHVLLHALRRDDAIALTVRRRLIEAGHDWAAV